MYVLGFDPGGKKQFGWCTAQLVQTGELNIVNSGIANDAVAAVSSATQNITDGDQIAGVGIDSPLYWVHQGTRRADLFIRSEMRRASAPVVGSTVQQVNSLRGACLVQGIITAHLLRSTFSSVRITETHPKALLWLIAIANNSLRTVDVRMSHLKRFITGRTDSVSEHERDAALGAIAAWSMVENKPGWKNLYLTEGQTFVPVPPVEYWMPIPNVSVGGSLPSESV